MLPTYNLLHKYLLNNQKIFQTKLRRKDTFNESF